MKSKKLKRLLSLTLSAAMAASMVSTPVNAGTVADNTASALEETADGLMDEGAAISGGGAADEAEDPEPEALEGTEEGEGVAEALAEELHSANGTDEAEPMPLADDGAAGGNEGDSSNAGNAGEAAPGGSEDATPAKEIVVGDNAKAGQLATLDAAIKAAQAEGAAKTITLAKDAALTGEAGEDGEDGGKVYNLDGVAINTNGHMITIPKEAIITLNNATIRNDMPAEVTDNPKWSIAGKNRLMLDAVGTLKINGGTYETAGVQLLKVTGTVTIGEEGDRAPEFACTATVGADENWYDTSTLIDVDGAGAKLTMYRGEVNAKVGNYEGAGDCGMFGIYIWHGGELVLGKAGQSDEDGPKIESMFSAIAMNNTTAPGKITVNSGTYTTYASCTEKYEKFNAVVYLPASANVKIKGGTFTEKGTEIVAAAKTHAISIPYTTADGNSVRLNLAITGGNFNASDSIFFKEATVPTNTMKIAVSGGTFSAEPDLVAEGYEAYEKDGKWEVSTAAVAKIGTTGYNSLESALAAATADDTITLCKDIELAGTEPIVVSKKKIETAGHMIKVPDGVKVTLESVTITNKELATGGNANTSWSKVDAAGRKVMLFVAEGGTLAIKSSKFTTKGAQLLSVNGTVTVEGADTSFECTAEENEISSLRHYDGVPLIGVSGAEASFTMKEGSIKANKGNGTNCGMYGIFVGNAGTLELGTVAENGATAGPEIDSMFAAVGMNYTVAPGTITINGGTYTSHVACTSETEQKFNTAVYLPATANVTIKGGTFTATHANNAPNSVISVPYADAKVNLVIEGGKFMVSDATEDDQLFFEANPENADDNKNTILIRGGTFGFNPESTNHVAGCHTTTKNSDGTWTVNTKENDNHSLTWVPKEEPTCWKEGVIGHYECPLCHKMYTTKTDGTELPADKVAIPKKEHVAGEKIEETPSCLTDGWKPHYECKNCHLCYATLEELIKDTTGSGHEKDYFKASATGHNFYKEDAPTEANVIFNWDNFKPEAFETGTANGVTATRTCSKCGKVTEEAEVTVELDPDASTNHVCTTPTNVTLVATASFKNGKYEKPVEPADQMTVTDKVTKEFPAKAHTYNDSDVEFDWSKFDPCDFEDGAANEVTASVTCSVCNTTCADVKVKVTCDTYPKDGILLCKDDARPFNATATFDSTLGAGFQYSKTEEQKFTAPHNLGKYEAYQAPTCTQEGRWGYYTCSACGKRFFGEDSAEKDDYIKTDGELEIAMISHQFAPKSYAWEDEEQDDAKVIFRCTACKEATVTLTKKDGVTATPVPDQAPGTCGDEITATYNVSVPFDKNGVDKGDDGKFIYNKDSAKNPVTYTSTLTKKTTQKHKLSVTEVEWVDSTGNNGVHAVSQGIKATLQCDSCKKTIVATNQRGIISSGTTILDPSITVAVNEELVQDADKTQAATCMKEGKATYSVKVSYDNDDGQGMQVADTRELSTKTDIDPNAHTWSELDWQDWIEEEAVKVVDGVRIPPVYSIKATRYCTNGCSTFTENAPQKFETATEPKEDDTPYILVTREVEQKKTCVRSGITNYVATAYCNKETVKTAEGILSQPDPMVFNDPVEGHQIEVKWDWTDDSKVPIEKLTGLTVERYCPNCSKSEDPEIKGQAWVIPYTTITLTLPENMAVGETVDDKGDGTGTLKVKKTGQDATCEEPGTTRYTAYWDVDQYNPYENTRSLVNSALGHEFKWHIDWTDKGIGGDGRFSATAVKKCTRDGVVDQSEKTLSVKYTNTPSDCSNKGKETWTITDPPSSLPEDYTEDCLLEQTNPLELNKDGHSYGTATVEWDEKTHENKDGEEVLGVTFTRTCTTNASHKDTATFEATTDGTTDNCASGYTWTYKVAEEELTALKEQGWILPQDAGTTNYTVTLATGNKNHNLLRVAGGNSNDCAAIVHPTYYKCKRCQNLYTSLTATTLYTGPTHEEAKPQGHLYGDPEFSWVEGEKGKTARATFTCQRSGCATTATGHSIEITASFDASVAVEEVEPQCEDTLRKTPETSTGVTLENGQGYAWGLVTLDITEKTATDNLKAGDHFEGDLDFVIDPVWHEFENGKCKWCEQKGGITVIFHGRTTEISREYYSPSNLPATVAVPTPTNQLGYVFKGWALSEGGTTVEDISTEILKLSTEDKTIDVYAIYAPVTETATVTVVNAYKVGDVYTTISTANPVKVTVGTNHQVIALTEMAYNNVTYYFSHWEKVDTENDAEVAVETNATYEFYIQTTAEVTLRAVYVENTEEAMGKDPKTAITDIYGTSISGTNKLSFASVMSIPIGYEVREVGFLYSLSSKVAMDNEKMTIENIGQTVDEVALPHKQQVMAGTEKTNVMTIQIPTSMESRMIYVRPYVTVRQIESGEITTVYGNVVCDSFENRAPAATE